MQFQNKYGTIDVLPTAGKLKNKTLGVSMSGGADSTMLCILLAKTIETEELNITLQPFSGHDLWAPLDTAGLPNIITFIKSQFPNVKINWPVSVVFDTQGVYDGKNIYIGQLKKNMMDTGFINDFLVAGSRGPELEFQLKFTVPAERDWKPIKRIPGYHQWDEVSKGDPNFAPFKDVDKRFIVQCYKDFGYESLLKQTNSCTDPAGNCGECWWCQERSWAIDTVFGDTINNIIETVEDSI